MSFNQKTDWVLNETVYPADLNRIEQGIKDVDNRIYNSVADINTLKLVDTTNILDNTIVLVKSLGFFRFDKLSVETGNNDTIITPNTGGGRWKLLVDSTGKSVSSRNSDLFDNRSFEQVQGFYADLEAYYGNTKLIDDFQDISKWTAGTGAFTQSEDTNNTKLGNKSLKITKGDNIAGGISSSKSINIDFSILNNGEPFSNSDYIYFVFYVSDHTKFANVGLYFSQDSNFIVNAKYIQTTNLVTGWNFIKIKKSDFLTAGTGSWTGVTYVYVRPQTLANAQNAYVSFQLIQLVKADPVSLIEMPNPFQKFGVRELIVDEQGGGDEFCLYKGHNSPVKIITLKSVPSLFSFKYPKFATDNQLIFMTMEKASTTDFFGYLSFIKDEENRISLFYNAKELILSGKINSVQFIEKVPSEILGNTANLSLEKRGNKYIGIITSEDKSHTISLDDVVLEDTYPYLGIGANATKYNSFSITEISHAHHSDIAENAVELQKSVRELKGILEYTNLDTVFTPGLYHLNTTNTNMPISGNGFLEVTPHVKGSISYLLQDVTMWTANPYSMRRFQRVMLQGIWRAWDEFSWAKTPTETVITTGFAAGWSGQISYRKTQENIIALSITDIQKSTDIMANSVDTIYTLPASYMPYRAAKVSVSGLNVSAIRVNGSSVDIVLATNGTISVISTGTVTTNVRRLAGIQILAI